jgi:hypothetical protein
VLSLAYKKVEINKQKGAVKQQHWSDRQRMNAVAVFVTTGSASLTSQTTKIPYDTISYWKKQQWWKDTIAEMRNSQRMDNGAKLKKVFDKAVIQLEERIDNGDWVYNQKTGKMQRKLLSGRDLNQITKDAIDKQIVLDKLLDQPKQDEEDIKDRLARLMEEFKKISNPNYKPQREVIDLDDISKTVEHDPSPQGAIGIATGSDGYTASGTSPGDSTGSSSN